MNKLFSALLLLVSSQAFAITGSLYSPDTWGEVQASKIQTAAVGVSGTATANTTTNIDFALTDDSLIRGIEIGVVNSNPGDTMTLQVIVGGSVVATPVTSWNAPVMSNTIRYESVAPQKIPGTATLRLRYTSTSLLTSPTVAINYLLLKVLF